MDKNFSDSYYNRFKLEGKFQVKLCRNDPVKFAYYMLGKKLWKHQIFLTDKAVENRFNIWCLPRQTGKSVTIAVLALWAAWFSKYSNTGMERLTSGCKVYIMSRTEDQAKELLLRIRELIREGDLHMSKLLRNNAKHMTDFYSSEIGEPNNKFQITFKNGSSIKCVPPTDSVRGKSADWFFIDEAAFLKTDGDPDALYYESVEPTIRQTNGKMILCSTPRGQQGFYYKILDPFENFPVNDWDKVWFHYDILEDVSEVQYQEIIDKEKKMRSEGNGKSFEQEYEARFVSSSESFFDSDGIDNSSGGSYKLSELFGTECVLGVDYGMVNSRTALAISYYDMEEEKIITCYVKRFKSGKDLNDVVPFIKGLMKRFNIIKIVADDCPEGYSINQDMANKGLNVDLFNFTREKTETYCSYRNYLNRGKVGVLTDKDLLMEMKGLQQEETINGKLKIFKGGGLTDDLCDALIMSAKTWLKEDSVPYELVLV